MAFLGCAGGLPDGLLDALRACIDKDRPDRLADLLPMTRSDQLDQHNLLHQASWAGHTACVHLLLQHGADANLAHRKNGCTALHLAHLCQEVAGNPGETVAELVEAGADIDSEGSAKCGRTALEHAVQHQKLGMLQALTRHKARINLRALLIGVDVGCPDILRAMLEAGAEIGRANRGFWGPPLSKLIRSSDQLPPTSLMLMFQYLVEATVCKPRRVATKSMVTELKMLSRVGPPDYSLCLYRSCILNGLAPGISRVVGTQLGHLIEPGLVDEHVTSLQDICVSRIRSLLCAHRNVMFGLQILQLPLRLSDKIRLNHVFTSVLTEQS